MTTLYPTYAEYNTAVANLHLFARDPRLSHARPEVIKEGRLVAYSGGYARVYPVRAPREMFALRCFTADVPHARERYTACAAYLSQQRLPYFARFEYLENALAVAGKLYPVVWMEWVEGHRLRDYVAMNLGNPGSLRALAEEFREMMAMLQGRGISHGDLEDENIIVQHGPRVRLVDYDSLFVPALSTYADTGTGVAHYQHPRRMALRRSGARVDYFASLVIYLSLLAYAEAPALWNPRAEKRLLFTEADFAKPEASPIFQRLGTMSREVRVLAFALAEFCREADPRRLPPLEAVISDMVETPSYARAPRTDDPRAPAPAASTPSSPPAVMDRPPPQEARASVFVVHGRNLHLRDAMFSLLRAAGLEPIEWVEAVAMTGSGSPTIAQILEAAFANAQAVVVLLTPDDQVRLRDELVTPGDGASERELRHQARPNVLFEAGMALGSHPTRTILVQVGDVKPFSDVAGRHLVYLRDDAGSRHDLLLRLKNAGCPVNFERSDWMRIGKFTAET